MKISEFVGLKPQIQKDTAKDAIKAYVKPERQTECLVLVDTELELFVAFLKATHRLLSSGVSHYGARSIIEHLRFHSAVSGREPTFKINNNWPPILARTALAMFDELYVLGKPFFECREFLATDRGRAA